MIPIRETGRFPRLYKAAIIFVGILLTALTGLMAYSCHPTPFNSTISNLLFYIIVALVISGVGVIGYPLLLAFIINHLSGREVIGDTTAPISVYATAYSITTAFVVPYAYNCYDREGDPYCNLYLSFSYADIRAICERLRLTHQIIYRHNTLSFPGHLGRRIPLLTRRTAERLRREMEAPSSDPSITPDQKRIVLCYSFYPSYDPRRITLPEHQVFLSWSYIDELRLRTPAGIIPSPSTELTASVGPNQTATFTIQFLQECDTRISARDEFIYIPMN